MYRHVLCIYPYRVQPGCSVGFPPLGLEIIATALKPHAEAIDVVDLRCEQRRTTDFLRPDTDLVCFSVNWDRDTDFAREQIRSVPPDILTIVGGRHATEDPKKWLSDCPNIDVLVRGDGEEIVKEISQGRPMASIAGISYRDNGSLLHNPARHCAPVRDDFYPDRDLRRYSYTLDLAGLRGRPLDMMASSRGCPFNCKFCSFSRNPWGEKRAWSARSPESVVRELEEIDADVVGFMDDIFTHDPERVSAICDLIMARGIRKRYVVNARIEIARRPDVLRKMERAGFALLLLGIESANDRTLRSMNKGFNTKQVREYFRVLKRSSMLLLGYFIAGNIGETDAEMRRIVPFARELGIDLLNLCLLRSEPYSGMEELVAGSPGYHVSTDIHRVVYSDRYPVRHLRRLQRQLLFQFYTPGHVLHVVKKSLRNGLITPGMLARLPWLLVRKILEPRGRRDSAWGSG